jgi:hypothetical protein
VKYRKQDQNGDYVFGGGSVMLQNSPDTVAQAVLTRLKLYTKEWFLDTREGLDLGRILGSHTQGTRDSEVQQRILGTPGVTELLAYSSSMTGRKFSVATQVQTVYGIANITGTL